MAEDFDCTNLTISRNLKKTIGVEKFNEIYSKSKSRIKNIDNEKNKESFETVSKLKKKNNDKKTPLKKIISEKSEGEIIPMTPFIEITPLNYVIENSSQKDLSSIPLAEAELPNVVYMIVNVKIELVTKYLKDYPDWQFLPVDELNRKTIEIYKDMKNAKRFCNREQKVIKVPNTKIFEIVAPILLSRGISRIISSENLIAL